MRNRNIRKIVAASLIAGCMILMTGCGGTTTAPEKSSDSTEKIADAGTAGEDLSGKWLMVRYAAGDTVLEYDRLGEAGMNENTYFDLDGDGSGTFSMMGSPMEVQLHDGKVSVQGVDLYTYSFPESDILEVDMAGSIYTLAREGSDALTAYQGVTTQSSDNLYAATDEKNGGRDSYNPMENEIEYEADGIHLYYELQNDNAVITWLYAEAEDLYIPEEIDGHTVVGVNQINGKVTNIYYPYGVKEIDRDMGPVIGVKSITFGYGDKPSEFEAIFGHLDNPETVETIAFNDNIKEINFSADVNLYQNLKEVVNPPKPWSEGIAGSEKILASLNSSDADKYIGDPSTKVADLTKTVISGASTDEDRLFKISEWICDNIDYNGDMAGRSKFPDDPIYADVEIIIDPDEVLDYGSTICDGYARLTREMCWAAGIPAVYVSGDTPFGLHAWNAVYTNDTWRFVDTTWSDSDYNTEYESEVFREYTQTLDYDYYMSNPELQEAYSWEELQEIIKPDETQSFVHNHEYYDVPYLAFSANHIAEEFE